MGITIIYAKKGKGIRVVPQLIKYPRGHKKYAEMQANASSTHPDKMQTLFIGHKYPSRPEWYSLSHTYHTNKPPPSGEHRQDAMERRGTKPEAEVSSRPTNNNEKIPVIGERF